MGTNHQITERERDIVLIEYRLGYGLETVARRTNLKLHQVRQIVSEAGIMRKRGGLRPRAHVQRARERADEARRMYEQGRTISQVAKAIGVSTQTATNILRSVGTSIRPGGGRKPVGGVISRPIVLGWSKNDRARWYEKRNESRKISNRQARSGLLWPVKIMRRDLYGLPEDLEQWEVELLRLDDEIASDAPWTDRHLRDCLREAGVFDRVGAK